MYGRERRRAEPDQATLRQGLTPAQLQALETLEHFKWRLRFVRRPLFRDPVPVVFDQQGQRFLVLEPDGSLNETPGITIRN